ncbi:hypothetical protein Pth03_47260 [Planotetraspora thailandica]|uniref:Uncharacterized protein n=1 Tax=Planotetraspora thailandica TaxID=487172 RepID=A0A8J3V691_9ACTN|nr:hypothetical protein [Planotetraspora thailandica]GII56337.1 hypothetical protein Pth03_47260 [Planotetraspora thailandica]
MNLSPDQARELAERYFGESATEVGIAAVDGGYVAWIANEEPADPSVPPETVGGGCVVIDGATGDMVVRPLLCPHDVAEQWPASRTGAEPPDRSVAGQ